MRATSVLFLIVFVGACSDPVIGEDASRPDAGAPDAVVIDAPASDASETEDAPSGEDAPADGGTRADAYAPDDSGASSAADVAACEETARMLADACGGQPDRTCEALTHLDRCSVDDARALRAGLACLLERSMGSCRTFGNPSGSEACIERDVAPFVDAARLSLATRIADACAPATPEDLLYGAARVGTLGSGAIAMIEACFDTATGCAGFDACYRSVFPERYACFE